ELEPGADRAGRRRWSGIERCFGEDRPVVAKTGAFALSGQYLESCTAALKHLAAFRGIAPQGCPLALGGPAGRIAPVERGPGVVLRMIGKPTAPREKERA